MTVVALKPSDKLPAKQLDLIRRTVAADCNNDEFDLFVMAAQHAGLDPFRKQISAIVFSKDNAKKRKMSIITTIDGFRTIAERTGRYRPDDQNPVFEYDPALVSPANPLGLVSASVAVFKQDGHGQWFRAPGVAYWDEFAPVKDEWVDDPATGRRKPSGRPTVDGNWAKMGRVMLSKCAEAQALRRAFPDAFSGIYEASEMERAQVIDATPSEIVDAAQAQERLARIGGHSILFQMDPMADLEALPVGKIVDRVDAALRDMVDHRQVEAFERTNKEAFRQFWAHNSGDALAVKQMIADRKAALAGA